MSDTTTTTNNDTTTTTNISSFTNDSAMMIAYERHLETLRGENALFQDPFASALSGDKGESLSNEFGKNAHYFKFEGWPEFHKTWVAVRTKYIDDQLKNHTKTGNFSQVVNLGAGMDTRAYRLPFYSSFVNGSFEVDMEVVNQNKEKIFKDFLDNPKPHCPVVHNVTLDFLNKEILLSNALAKFKSFDATQPTIFICEGLVMYLGEAGKLKLLRDVSAVAAPGSVFILQFMEDIESNSSAALSQSDATATLEENGWDNLIFSRYGDETLNYGRFPTDKFKSSASFSFLVCTKK